VERLLAVTALLGSSFSAHGFRLSQGELQTIVHGAAEILFASNVALGGLDRGVAEKKLDLSQLATSGVAQAGARPPQVMRGERLYFRPTRGRFHYVPNNVLCDSVAPNRAVLAYRPEEPAADDRYAFCPSINGGLDPGWNGDRSHVTTLADEIHNRPVILATLDGVNSKTYDLRTPQSMNSSMAC
jgi:hypothetical protein